MVKTSPIWKTPSVQQLVTTLSSINDPKTMRNFLGDALTEGEIIEISARLEAAKMLQNGARYSEIIEKTKLSSRTVARISTWLREGYGGYQAVTAHHNHSKPRLRAV